MTEKNENSIYGAFHIYHPGELEVFVGPMKSGKGNALHERIKKIPYQNSIKFIAFKPDTDKRGDLHNIYSRNENNELIKVMPCTPINANKPELMLDMMYDKNQIYIIDEIQFFNKKIYGVLDKLIRRYDFSNNHAPKNIIAAGLDLDFKGEPFETTGAIMCLADVVHKLKATCEDKNCALPGTRTARYNPDGSFAHYNDEIVVVGDKDPNKDPYGVLCKWHHIVPGKP